MIEAIDGKPLRVLKYGTTAPFISTPVSRLEELCSLLTNHQIQHTIEANFISLNGGPEMAVVDLDEAADVAEIQAILDSIQ